MGWWLGRQRGVLLLTAALAFGAAACASSTSETTPFVDGGDGGGDGTSPDSTVDGMMILGGDTGADTNDGGCNSVQTECDGGCTNVNSDPNNCGHCGNVCSSNLQCAAGNCTIVCSPPEILCDVAPTPSPDAGPEAGAADGGGGTPYCANLSNDPNNCGICGKVCEPDHICSTGNCTLNCPSNETACPSGDLCIPNGSGECCTAADCVPPAPAGINGAICPTPGGQCQCPPGDKVCTASNTCIPEANCCSDMDCNSIPGQECVGAPNGLCQCIPGTKFCQASNSCILSTACCVDTDCTSGPSGIAGETCQSGTCECTPGYTVCPEGAECIPDATCCTSATCPTGQACSGFGGSCDCPTGTRTCTNNGCITIGTCCPTDPTPCPVGGESCPNPGGACACPGGEYPCTANNTCIQNADCCSNANCQGGEVCSGPGGTCSCPLGDTYCTATGSCIPSTDCCTAANCPDPFEVAATACTLGTCSIAACDSGYYNTDGVYSDGCECKDDAWGKTCASATSVGTIGVGGSTSVTGVLPFAGDQNFFIVLFTGNTNCAYHPDVYFSNNPNGEFAFEIDAGCGGAALSCGTEVGSTCVGKTAWEVSNDASQCCGCANWTAVPPVGNGGTVAIRVYRVSASPTCDSYTLAIAN